MLLFCVKVNFFWEPTILHPLNIRLGFKKNLKRFNHQFYIDIINVYNQKNTLGLSYIPSTGEGNESWVSSVV